MSWPARWWLVVVNSCKVMDVFVQYSWRKVLRLLAALRSPDEDDSLRRGLPMNGLSKKLATKVSDIDNTKLN